MKAAASSGDTFFRWLVKAFGGLVILIEVALVSMLLIRSLPALRASGGEFFVSTTWDPVSDIFGGSAFLYGTMVSSLLAMVIAIPLGLGVAIFISEYAPRFLKKPIVFFVELLAAIPSVIFGLWGLFFLVPWLRTTVEPFFIEHLGFLPLFRGPPFGVGMFAAGVLLSIMVLPIIASLSREVLETVPDHQREAALALGATRWEMVCLAVLRYGSPGLLGAMFLGFGRALGETMAVTMVIGNNASISSSLFAPAQTIASLIANEYAEASGDLHLSALSLMGFLLFLVTLVVNSLARLLIWRIRRGQVEVSS